GARELPRRGVSNVQSWPAGDELLAGAGVSRPARTLPDLQLALDRLYDGFNAPESAVDPIQIVRRHERPDDREGVAFIAAGLAFGRVASVMASIENVCRVIGPAPASFVRQFEPRTHGDPLRVLGHRWTRGHDFVALIWMLRQLIEQCGSLERCFAAGNDPQAPDIGPALETF